MKKRFRGLLSLLLAVLLAASVLPMPAMAVNDFALTSPSLIGTITGWNGDIPLNETAPGIWQKTITGLAAGTHEFKIRNLGVWDVSLGGTFGSFGTAFDLTAPGSNIAITLSAVTDLTFTLDLTAYNTADGTGAKLTVTDTPAPQKTTFTASVIMQDYTYGETPSVPAVSDNPGQGEVTYRYNTTQSDVGAQKWENITATTLNADTYYIRAEIAETATHAACTTDWSPFSVKRGRYSSDVLMTDYTFGGTLPTPAVTNNPESGAVKFWYNTENMVSGSVEWKDMTSTTLQPATYYMWAEIDSTANYYYVWTSTVPFTVAPQQAPAPTPPIPTGMGQIHVCINQCEVCGKCTNMVCESVICRDKCTRYDVPFSDVAKTDPFYEDVMLASHAGLMEGVGEGKFAPYLTTDRAMIATVLWRLEGQPAANRSIPFMDIDVGGWYGSAVIWANQMGIVLGYGDGTFRPHQGITREELAAVLYRYAKFKGMDVTASADVTGEVSNWAKEAVRWAAAEKILLPVDGQMLAKEPALRYQVATAFTELLYR